MLFRSPAVTFTLARDGPSDIAYTMGVDAENPDVFKVEKSTLGDVFYPLGHSPPLFVIKKNLFGMGVNRPDSNLHVSGNSGLLISAQLRPTSPVQLQQSVPQLVFDGTNAAFFVGESAVVSTQNMGKYSVVMGKDSVASGIFSAAYGRDNQSKEIGRAHV